MVCGSSDLRSLSVSIFSWDQGTCLWDGLAAQSGDRPSGRGGHSLTVIGRNGFLFGGSGERDSKPVVMNDVYALDLQGFKIPKKFHSTCNESENLF